MKYIMALTRRHPFPEDARETIFPGDYRAKRLGTENEKHHQKRLDAWGDFTIPADCTELTVYMSGYRALWLSLVRVCKARGIVVDFLFPRNKSVRGRINAGKTPVKEDYVKVRKLRF